MQCAHRSKALQKSGESPNISAKLSIFYIAIYFLMTQQTQSLSSKLPAPAELRGFLSGHTFYLFSSLHRVISEGPYFLTARFVPPFHFPSAYWHLPSVTVHQGDSSMSSSYLARISYSLLLLCLVLLCAIIKKLLVHLHEQLQCIVYQPMDCPAKKWGKKNKSWWDPPGPQPRVRTSSADKN